MKTELYVETDAQPAVIDTHPASRPAPAVSKSNLFVSSFFVNQTVMGLKMIVEMQAVAPATVVMKMTSAGLLFSLSWEMENDEPPLNMSQLQNNIREPAVTKVWLA